jgi:hypothetical protein
MQITDSLNLAIPFGDGLTAFHTPISRAVYEAHYAALNATRAAIARKGIHYQMGSGPGIANLVLRDEGKKDADERSAEDTTPALLGEIKRLTTVLVPGPAGYEQMPIDAAINRGILDEEDWSELEAQIVFFTCHVATAKKAERKEFATSIASVLNGSITPSASTAYAASLPTSMKAAPTRSTPASSLPV